MNNLFRLKECANLYMSNLQRVQPYAVLEIVGPNNSIRYIYCRNIHKHTTQSIKSNVEIYTNISYSIN